MNKTPSEIMTEKLPAPAIRKPVKYLTNKELLAEIARCKRSYCSFLEEGFSEYDAIVNQLDDVDDEFLELVCARRSKDLSKKGEEPVVVVPHGLVIRLMTYDHIPLDPDRKRKSRAANQTHAMTTFPPFKHYVLEIVDGEKTFREVGRSHWEGGFENGWFAPEKGKVSERMGRMYQMLVERYSRRGNWRGYCERDDVEALTNRGWLPCGEITTQDQIMSCNDGTMTWSDIKSIYHDDFEGDLYHLTGRGIDAVVTPEHKFLTTAGLKEVDSLSSKDKIILMGEPSEDIVETYPDALVELLGWIVTEGTFEKRPERKYTRISIYQNEGVYADRIRRCVLTLGLPVSEYKRKRDGNVNTNVCFHLRKSLCETVTQVIGDQKILPMSFILSLSQRQRVMLINTMVDADGWRSGYNVSYDQKCKLHMDAFVALCAVAGVRTTTRVENMTSYGKTSKIYRTTLTSKRSNHRRVSSVRGLGKPTHAYPNSPSVYHKGKVWCPETEFGCFLARRNGTVYISGNSYLDEMKSLSLMQLCQVGLQFDESKSSNPFAFYTTTITNCLAGETEILTLEHGVVNIENVAGQHVTVLDGNGDWLPDCLIMDYGVQETRLTSFQNGGGTKVDVWSTGNHRWISSGESVVTNDLHGGAIVVIDDLRPSKVVSNKTSYSKGMVHGLIYGDGTHSHTRSSGEMVFSIRLCANIEETLPYLQHYNVSYPPHTKGDPVIGGIIVNGKDLKSFPDVPGEDLDYFLGFLRGWFGADGCVSTVPAPTLCGSAEEHEWLKKWGPLVGWHVNGFTLLSETTNFGQRKKASVNMHLRKSSMDGEDFINKHHRERWAKKPENNRIKTKGRKYDWGEIDSARGRGESWRSIAERLGVRENTLVSNNSIRNKIAQQPKKCWKVYGTRQVDQRRKERVYCPVVATTHSLALPSGIHTGQCFTRIFNLEKKNQNIRDDLLISMGAAPSYTRQIDNELSQNGSIEPTVIPTRRGRKTAAQVNAEKEAQKPLRE